MKIAQHRLFYGGAAKSVYTPIKEQILESHYGPLFRRPAKPALSEAEGSAPATPEFNF